MACATHDGRCVDTRVSSSTLSLICTGHEERSKVSAAPISTHLHVVSSRHGLRFVRTVPCGLAPNTVNELEAPRKLKKHARGVGTSLRSLDTVLVSGRSYEDQEISRMRAWTIRRVNGSLARLDLLIHFPKWLAGQPHLTGATTKARHIGIGSPILEIQRCIFPLR